MGVELRTIGGWAGIATTATFVAGIVLMAASGVETLIPDTGPAAQTWVAEVDAGGSAFLAGGWLVVLGGVVALVALVGFHDALRDSGPWLVLAPVLAVLAMTLVTASHVIPLGMASHFVPGYVAADAPVQSGLAVTLQVLAAVSLGLNLAGDTVLWGVVVPMYAVAVLRSAVLPHWIGWLGLFTALFGGWLGVLGAVVPAVEDFTFLGFLAFFVWMAAMGVAVLRGRVHEPATLPVQG